MLQRSGYAQIVNKIKSNILQTLLRWSEHAANNIKVVGSNLYGPFTLVVLSVPCGSLPMQNIL